MATIAPARTQSMMDPSTAVMDHSPGLTIDTAWTAENFTPANLSSLEAALSAGYQFQMSQLDSAVSDDGLSSQLFNTSFADTSPRSRYVSLDCDRTDEGFMLPLSKARSLTNDAKESAKERRRTQNRFAQRAYRQRKEQAIKDQEKEIETLKLQLAKEKKLNQALAKVIEFLKERLKSKQPPTAEDLPTTKP